MIDLGPEGALVGSPPCDRARYWEVMHAHAVERIRRKEEKHSRQVEALRAKLKSAREEIKRLEKRNSELRALVKLRAKQAFGKKSERRRPTRSSAAPSM